MSTEPRRKSSRLNALGTTKHGHEETSPNKPLSMCRAPRSSKKKALQKKARDAAYMRWRNPTAAAVAAPTAAGDTVRWGELFTQAAIASATPAVEHLLRAGTLKGWPHAGSRRLRSIAAAVLAAELGGPEHGQLGPTELSKLAHGFARW